jgi:hypothetical protein
VGLVEFVPWVLVVAVVGEAAEIEVELVGPVGVGKRRVEDNERVSAVARAGGDAEAAPVAAREESRDRVVAEGAGGSAFIGYVDVEVGVGELVVRNPSAEFPCISRRARGHCQIMPRRCR